MWIPYDVYTLSRIYLSRQDAARRRPEPPLHAAAAFLVSLAIDKAGGFHHERRHHLPQPRLRHFAQYSGAHSQRRRRAHGHRISAHSAGPRRTAGAPRRHEDSRARTAAPQAGTPGSARRKLTHPMNSTTQAEHLLFLTLLQLTVMIGAA